MTNTKTTATKVAPKKTVSKKPVPKKAEEPKQVTEPRKFLADDLIECESNFVGSVIMVGKKTGNMYQWDEIGEVQEVMFSDLMSEIVNKKSAYIYKPLIIVKDKELLEQRPRLTELYANLYSAEDIQVTIASGKTAEIADMLNNMNDSGKEMVGRIAATMIAEGILDSMRVIKVLDECLGTEFVKQLEMDS